jgi:hypothetical protein
LAGVEEQGDRFADRAQAVGGQGLGDAGLDGGEHSLFDARVGGDAVEPEGQGGEGLALVLGEQGGGRGDELVDVLAVDLGEQVLAGREVPVEGALADACLLGDRVEPDLARVGDGRPGGGDDPGAVACGVGTEAGRRWCWGRGGPSGWSRSRSRSATRADTPRATWWTLPGAGT